MVKLEWVFLLGETLPLVKSSIMITSKALGTAFWQCLVHHALYRMEFCTGRLFLHSIFFGMFLQLVLPGPLFLFLKCALLGACVDMLSLGPT